MMMDIKEVFLQWLMNFLIKKSSGCNTSGIAIMQNQQLKDEVHKPIITKVVSKVFQFLLCVIGIYSKYGLVAPLKSKKCIRLLMLFKTF